MRLSPKSGDRRRAVAAGNAAAFALVLLFVPPLYAGGEYTILGAGGRPCGSWLQARNPSTEREVLQSWVLGYITSVNANVLTTTQDVAAGMSPEKLFSWIDTYCTEHPLDSIARATGGLLDNLRVKSKAK